MSIDADCPSPAAPPLAVGGSIAGLIIRARELDDCVAVAELMSLPLVRWGTHWMPFASREQTRQWIANAPEGSVQVVAILDGRLVGTAGIVAFIGRRSHVGGIWLCVHDEFQGRGIGGAIVAALIDAADNWLNLQRLELTVYVDSAAAIALYKKFGFRIEGTLRQHTFRGGVFVDSYAMARLKNE